MKISYAWLQDYLDFSYSPEKLGEILTDLGLEVEGMEEVESIKGGLKGVVIGQVMTCEQHPNADRLSVCTVDVGQEAPLNIVCGAPNIKAGQKVFVATAGTTLYSKEGEPWKIKKGKIRGAVSAGMICAEDELGLGDDHDGIVVLAENAIVGAKAAEHLNLNSDYVYDIGLTPNRSDATGHIGVARDLLAYMRTHEKSVNELTLPTANIETKTASNFSIEILNEVACPRYSAIVLSNISVKESPKWMKERLESIGVRSINNIVDITNYVLHEFGQPLHAFDADEIGKKQIKVQTLAAGTIFKSLDEIDRKLSDQDLMICDGYDNPMCIGGVFGGIGSGVTDETSSIFLESAYFDPIWIRKTSTRHLLPTDAAKCFEKGADPNNTVAALKRAAALMMEYADAKVSSSLMDVYPNKIKSKTVKIRYNQVNRLIGEDIGRDKIKQILTAMEMSFLAEDEVSLTISVPTNKSDVTREADIIEEILRVYGYNTVKIDDVLRSALSYSKHPDPVELREECATMLSNLGFLEAMALSLTNNQKAREIFGYGEDELVLIHNTSNTNLDTMRPHSLISALEVALHNQNRQQHRLKMFEFGKSYSKQDGGRVEEEFLSILISGDKNDINWLEKESKQSFFSLKKNVEIVLQKLGINSYSVSNEKNTDFLSYSQLIERGPISLVRYGKVDGKLCEKLGLKNDIFFAKFYWNNLIKVLGKGKLFVEDISKFPTIRRDLALVMDEGVQFGEIQRIASKVGKKILKEVSLFDIYRHDEHVGNGKKSYAISLLFEDKKTTLKDAQIDRIIDQLLKKLSSELNVNIR